jgi:arylsulfatase A-like enzyme
MRSIVSVIAVIILSLVVQAAPAQDKKAKRPNVIIFLADDLGHADIGFQGLVKDVKTPNIDAIAKEGVRFTQAYVSCPVCAPTRAGLLTGRYQQRFGFEQNPSPQTPPNYGLPNDQVLLAKVLKDAGYATAAVGKWHLGFEEQHHPMSQGFDEYFGFLAGAHGYYDIGEGKNAVLRGREPAEKVTYLTDDFGREAAAFVEKQAKGDKPYFLYVAFSAIHTPMDITDKYLQRFPDVQDEKRRQMLGMLSAMDDAIGGVMERVRAAKQEDNTLVFFLSDNGGPTGGNASRNDPFSGFKNNVREGGIRVPFAAQWKGVIPAGKTYEQPVIALDIFPTVLAATGAKQPEDQSTDGVDLVPYVTGKKGDDARPHDTLYWRYGEKWAVRDGDLKLTHAEAGPAKLYDLSNDPGEKNDLAPSKPEVRKQLREKYDAWTATLVEPRWKDRREKPLGSGQGKPGAGAGAGED